MSTAQTTAIHPFERSGLGRAPFILVGMVEKVYQACQGAPMQPAGTCDHCGTGIRYVFLIRSKDGKETGVGSDCVRKLDRADNALIDEVERKLRVLKRDKARERREAEEEKVNERTRQALTLLDSSPEIQARLAAKPHPAIKDRLTLLDYVEYMRRHAGTFGKRKLASIIEENRAA